MHKRSATLIAAGLVLTLAIGWLAVSLGLTGPPAADAAQTARPRRVVQVQRRTVTIHRQEDPEGIGGTTQLSLAASGSDDADDADEDRGEDPRDHEDEDHGGLEVEDD
jgi:hypothetical protein